MTLRAGTAPFLRVALLALCALAAAESQAIAQVALPTVDFIAEARNCNIDLTGETRKETCLTVSTHYTPKRWRTDWMLSGKPDMTAITDVRERTITTIHYEEKRQRIRKYDPKDPSALDAFLPHHFSSNDRVGEEVVGGRRTVKYARNVPTDVNVLWLTGENVVVRREIVARSDRKVLLHETMEVTKLVIGPFDPSLLKVAIPTDFKREVMD